VGAGPAGRAFRGGGEEVAGSGRPAGLWVVVVPDVPGTTGIGGTMVTAGTLGPDEVFRGHLAEEGLPTVPA